MTDDEEQIPLVDLVALHAVVADDVAAAIARVLGSQHFVRGEEVEAFEREYAEFSGIAHCVGTGNGTDAIELALRAAAAATRYDDTLADLEMVRRTKTMPGNEHVVHLYVVRVPKRDRVLAGLHQVGIGAGVHYARPIHELGAFASLDYPPGSFPVAETASRELLSLPVYPGITPGQQEKVCTALRTLVLDHAA